MKRYIRLKDNTIVDLKELKEKRYASKRYFWQEDDILIHIYDTEYECVVEYIYKCEIIAESDNIIDLIQVGDLVGGKFKALNFDDETFEYQVCYIYAQLGNFIDPFVSCITEIYTKQDDNYILVWDKERGVF